MSDPGKSGAGYPGWEGLFAGNSEFNTTDFIVEQMLRLVRTATIVRVISCTTNDQVGPVGFVTVLPLVNLVNGLFQTSPHKNLEKIPYSRVQGGKNAIICDPVKDDIGIAVFGDRDLSAVIGSKKPAPPGSRRHHDLADGLYLFGILSTAPTQWVRFIQDDDGNPIGMELVDVYGNKRVTSTDGMTDTDKNGNTIVFDSDGIKINGVLFDQSQNVTNVEEITNVDGHTLTQHVHGGVMAGGADTDTPTG